jgi:hypothetical protein
MQDLPLTSQQAHQHQTASLHSGSLLISDAQPIMAYLPLLYDLPMNVMNIYICWYHGYHSATPHSTYRCYYRNFSSIPLASETETFKKKK